MTNNERLLQHNAELRECIEIAESLPDAGGDIATPTQEKTIEISKNGVFNVFPDDGYTLNKVTANVNVPSKADALAARLNDTLTEYSSDEVISVGNYAFWGLETLESVSLPKCTSVSTASFQGCTALKSVRFDTCTSAGGTTFRGCTSLINLLFPVLKSTSTYIFADCPSIQRAVLPEILTLGGAAFQNCTSLEYVEIPNATSIGAMGFQNCSALTAVIIRQATRVCTLAATTAFAGTPIEGGTGYIFVPSSMLSIYKSGSNWSAYASQIRAYEDYPEISGG